MIYHDLEGPVFLPRRGAVFGIEALAMLAGALAGVALEGWMTRFGSAGLAASTAVVVFWGADRYAALRSARNWRWGLLIGTLTAFAIAVATADVTPVVLGILAALLVGEVGAVAATAAPWTRELAGWRPVFVVTSRLFAVITAACSIPGSELIGISAGSLGGVVLLLMALPLMFPAPAEIDLGDRTVRVKREACPRCGVPVDWPVGVPSHCTACGLIRRDVA